MSITSAKSKKKVKEQIKELEVETQEPEVKLAPFTGEEVMQFIEAAKETSSLRAEAEATAKLNEVLLGEIDEAGFIQDKLEHRRNLWRERYNSVKSTLIKERKDRVKRDAILLDLISDGVLRVVPATRSS